MAHLGLLLVTDDVVGRSVVSSTRLAEHLVTATRGQQVGLERAPRQLLLLLGFLGCLELIGAFLRAPNNERARATVGGETAR